MEARKYQCYVCGIVFDEPKEFKEHIIANHEEGREYLKCPLTRCGFPVRDLRAHFRAKHKYDKLPAGIQHRVAVWYDVRQPTKRKKKTNFKSGTFISKKNNGRVLHYRSGWEEEVYKILEEKQDVVSYAVEPFPVAYYWHDRSRQYYPDLQVVFIDGHVEIWEIKPSNQTKNQQNQAKWNSCKHYCAIRNWTFEVITEQRIEHMKNKKT